MSDPVVGVGGCMCLSPQREANLEEKYFCTTVGDISISSNKADGRRKIGISDFPLRPTKA